MRLGFLNRLRHGYGNIYTPHAGSMIIQLQRETGLANRTIVISERQVALLRVVGSRLGLVAVALFVGTWLMFAVQSVRVPVLSARVAELERDNRRIDSLQVALSRMHGRYEQVRQMLAATGSPSGPASARPAFPESASSTPNAAAPRQASVPTAPPPSADSAGRSVR
jgi:hypothetical protein